MVVISFRAEVMVVLESDLEKERMALLMFRVLPFIMGI
jgi:hypothetical protein